MSQEPNDLGVSLLGNVPEKAVDVLLSRMILKDRYSLIPELRKRLGRKLFVEFLELFGGTTFTVPSPSDLRRLVRESLIYSEVESIAGKEKLKPGSLALVAKRFGANTTEISRIWNKVRSELAMDGNDDQTT